MVAWRDHRRLFTGYLPILWFSVAVSALGSLSLLSLSWIGSK